MNASKSQVRAASLFGIAVDTYNDEYQDVAEKLEAASLPADGLPDGHTWRTAGKLSDDELKNLLSRYAASREAYTTAKIDAAGN